MARDCEKALKFSSEEYRKGVCGLMRQAKTVVLPLFLKWKSMVHNGI